MITTFPFDISIGAQRLADGQPVTGLPTEGFEVRDNGALQKVELVSREERSVHAVLVLDQSASLRALERAALKRAAVVYDGGAKPGGHKLEVRVKKHKGEVRARRGYFAR
jgi:hypothetical protein